MSLISKIPLIKDQRKGWAWTEETDPKVYNKHVSWPKISIITPSYNHAEFLEHTLRSILLQNYPNLEFIVIDGGSKDSSVEIIKKYEQWITYWVSESDNGQSHAINKGIEKATGDVINWINSDDFLLKDSLFEVGKFFIENPEISIIFGNAISVYSEDNIKPYEAAPFELFDFISRISIHQPSTFWRRAILDEIGNIDESVEYCMDYDLWMRIVFDYQSAKLPKQLTGFRRYEDSKSSNFNDQSNIYLDYRKIVCRLFATVTPSHINYLQKLGLYYNDNNITYSIEKKFSNDIQKKMIDKYIMTCAAQEYLLENKKRANQLLKSCFNKDNYKEAFSYLIKNNIGYRKIFHPYRKS